MLGNTATIATLVAQLASELTVSPTLLGVVIEAMRPRIHDEAGDYGFALAVAHELTVGTRVGSAAIGPITAESEGQLSRTYADAVFTDAGWWGLSTYGIRYWSIVKSFVFTPINRMVGVLDGLLCDAAASTGAIDVPRKKQSFVASLGQTDFPLLGSFVGYEDDVEVYYRGLYQNKSAITLVPPSIVRLVTPAYRSGDEVEVSYRSANP